MVIEDGPCRAPARAPRAGAGRARRSPALVLSVLAVAVSLQAASCTAVPGRHGGQALLYRRAGRLSLRLRGASCLGLRGGKGCGDEGDPCEGPDADSEVAEFSRTIEVPNDDDDPSAEGVVKQVLQEGRRASESSSEYDTGNGEYPLEGDLVSVRVTFFSAGKPRATTQDLLRLADDDAAGRQNASGAGAARQVLTPAEASQMPLHVQYGYGGLARVAHKLEARSVPGTFSFRLGSHPNHIVTGLEEAIVGMRQGERARITLSGHKGFDGAGFKGIARMWGIPPGSSADAEVELVSWNTIDATGDGGVVVTLPHSSAAKILKLGEKGEWRVLERHPSAHATVRLRCALRAVHHSIPGIGNTTTVVFPGSQDAGESPPEFARWVALGQGELPWGMELAAVSTAVAGVPFSVRLTGARYLDSCSGDGKEGREHCGAEAMTYEVVVDDWHEARNLTADGGVLLYQRNVGSPTYNVLACPIADGDQVLLDIQGRVLADQEHAQAIQAKKSTCLGGDGAGNDTEVGDGGGTDGWPAWQPSLWAVEDQVQANGGASNASQTPRDTDIEMEVDQESRACERAGDQPRQASDPSSSPQSPLSPPGARDLSWMQNSTWPRARRLVTVGNFATASGLERALMGLHAGQSAQVRLRPPYLNTFDLGTAAGASFGPATSAGLEFSFTVLAVLPATRRSLAARVELAARRRVLGNQLFAAGKYLDALAVYRLGADLVFHWKVCSRGMALADDEEEEDLMSAYDKERLRQASSHMEPAARRKYVRAMLERDKERQRRKGRVALRETRAESATGDGTWEEHGRAATNASTVRAAQQLRTVCVLNAVQCLLRLERPVEAKADCDKVLQDDGDNVRAFHRRCQANLDLGDVASAQADLQAILRLAGRVGGCPDAGESEQGQRISAEEIERLRLAIQRAEAAKYKAEKNLYGKMFASKSPKTGGGSSCQRASGAPSASQRGARQALAGDLHAESAGSRSEAGVGQVCREKMEDGGIGAAQAEGARVQRAKPVVQRMTVAGELTRPVVAVETAPDSVDEQARKRNAVFSGKVEEHLQNLRQERREDEAAACRRSPAAGEAGKLRYTPTHVAGADDAEDGLRAHAPDEEQAQIRNLMRHVTMTNPRTPPAGVGGKGADPGGRRSGGVKNGGEASAAGSVEGEVGELPSKADVDELFEHSRKARLATFVTLQQAADCARTEASMLLPPQPRYALEELRRGLVESEGEYEQLIAHMDAGLGSGLSASATRKLRILRDAFMYSLRLTSRLIARLAAALDPHANWDQLESANADAQGEEAEGERAAREAWARAAPFLHEGVQEEPRESVDAPGARLYPEGKRVQSGGKAGAVDQEGCRSSLEGVGVAADAQANRGGWTQRLEGACTRYKTSGGEKAMEAMDEMCELLKEVGMPERVRSQTHHARCPGHVENLRDSSQPCPNCQLIGKEIETASLAEGALEPTGGPVFDEEAARRFMRPLDQEAAKAAFFPPHL